jgi:outer membrane protein assembly factor BamB
MSYRRFRCGATVVFCGVLFATWQTTAAQADKPGWNRFRGPNGTGLAADAQIPSEFGPDKNLIWRTDLPKGYSSPVIDAGRIYLTGEEEQKLYTICLDQSDGHEIWRKEAPRDRKEKLDPRNHPASPSPAVRDGQVFVFFPDYGMIAYQADGVERWRKPLGPFTNLYGMGASPIVVDGLVILVCDQNLDSFVIAFDAESGDVVWKTLREEATSGHCSPVVYRPDVGNAAQIVVAGSFNLTAYEVTSGKKLWWVSGLCFEMKSTPFLVGDTAYINGFGSPQNQPDQNFDIAEFPDVIVKQDVDGDGVLSLDEMPDELSRNFFPAVDLDENQELNEREWNYFRASIASKNSMMAIRLGGSGDMTRQNTLWKYHKNIPQLPSPLLVGNQLLMISDRGIVTSLDPETGIEQYKGRIPGAAGSVYASPVAAGDKIFFSNTDGKIAVVQSGQALDVVAVNDLGEGIYATPAIVGNRIFVRTDQALCCFGSKDTPQSQPK